MVSRLSQEWLPAGTKAGRFHQRGLFGAMLRMTRGSLNRDKDTGRTLLPWMAMDGVVGILPQLVDIRFDVNEGGSDWHAPLHLSVIGNRSGAVKTLVEECNADMHMKDANDLPHGATSTDITVPTMDIVSAFRVAIMKLVAKAASAMGLVVLWRRGTAAPKMDSIIKCQAHRALALPPKFATSLAFFLGVAVAINVTVPETIHAGKETEITIGFDTWKQPYRYEAMYDSAGWSSVVPVCRNPEDPDVGCSNDGLYEHYQLYLSTEEFMTTCYLSDLIPTGTTNPKITIPKDLGPPLDSYTITAIEFNGTKMYTDFHGVADSSAFALADTTVTAWTTWELYGGWVKPAAVLPCSSYSCYRKCGLKTSDGKGNMGEGKDLDFFNCINTCDGIYADPNDFLGPWSWYRDWKSDEDGYIQSSSATWKGWDTTTRLNDYTTMDKTATTLYGTPTDVAYDAVQATTTSDGGTKETGSGEGDGQSAGVRMGGNGMLILAGCVVVTMTGLFC
ncbi:hypothetical protein MKZ38_000956 [Zalerion maritima]|uniref:Uncharacterized protein n=1 Tax=Zalerion maritima TaxID=339359 RepID=A0AAD5RYM6_9PEZI|nr:hypothetical protein MKZ38_000956 [Zalerion maritima]